MNKIFVCPSMTGCHVPLVKSYHHFIGAKNIEEARKVMVEWVEKEKPGQAFLIDKIRRDKSCEELEETFAGLGRMMK
jgi:hypothetical protein